MTADASVQIRLCEWGTVNHALPTELCQDIDTAANAWREINRLSTSPVSFIGPNGRQLCARQYVGVIEVGPTTIEIFPKLDAELIEAGVQRLRDEASCNTVMRNLLWMLDVADHRNISEAATAHLQDEPTSFVDLFAYLLGRNLLAELERGVPHSYETFSGDLRAVRGRIGLLEQITKNWNRPDRVCCAWDEFTSDTATNRLLKCACTFLAQRVNYAEAARLLRDCQTLLSEAGDVSPATALRDAENIRFDRSVERFKTSFDLARRLLAGIGHNLGVGNANTFVFLLDMNAVFESYVHAVLEAHFETAVAEQQHVGTLFRIRPGGISQRADYYWSDGSTLWIGDAKYKHLARGQRRSIRFSDLIHADSADEEDSLLAGWVLSASDVRQLTVYAELARYRAGADTAPNLMLLYPFVGAPDECQPDSVTAWNGSTFSLVPVRVQPVSFLGDAIQLPSTVAKTV